MNELGLARLHGWTWHPAEDAPYTADPHDRIEDLGTAGGHSYQKITRGGIVVAFVAMGPDGKCEYLLPTVQD